MFKNAYQRGLLTVFYSAGSNPLYLWDTHVQNGYMKRILDQELKALVFEIRGTNVSTTYMTCPKGKRVLGIIMPFLIMIVKNLQKYFNFEVTILDDGGNRRRFRIANFQSTTLIRPFCTVMPIGLVDGWNQIQFNLADFTRRAYNKQFMEVQNLKINANICLRRIYFAEKLFSDEELPNEYKLFLPLSSKGKTKRTSTDKENVKPCDNVQDIKDIKPSTSELKLKVQQKTLEDVKNIEKRIQVSISPERVSEQQFFTNINVASTTFIVPVMGSELSVIKPATTDSMIQSKVFNTVLTGIQEASIDKRSVHRTSSNTSKRSTNINGIELPSRASEVKISAVDTPVRTKVSTPTSEKTDQSEANDTVFPSELTEYTEEVVILDNEPENIDMIPKAQAVYTDIID